MFCSWQVPLYHAIVRAKNVRPPCEQRFNQRGAPLLVTAFRQRLVVFFSFFQPVAVGCIPVTRWLLLSRLISFVLHFLTHRSQQLLQFLTMSIAKLHGPARVSGCLLQ